MRLEAVKGGDCDGCDPSLVSVRRKLINDDCVGLLRSALVLVVGRDS